MSYWRVVDRQFLSDAAVSDVLPFGGDVDEVESILPSGFGLPGRNSEPCAEYAGGAIVEVGLISLGQSIEMAEAASPGMFEKMGMNIDTINAGLETINRQAAALKQRDLGDRVSCTAITHAEKYNDPSRKPYAAIWTAALTDAIEQGELDAAQIREQSQHWRALAVNGLDGLAAVAGVEEKAQMCNSWLNEAISTQAANQ